MGTVSRAMAVLTVIAESESEVAIIDLAAKLYLPQSTCHRLLDLLAADGFVERNPKLRRYGPGPNLQRVAALVAQRTDLTTLAAPIMKRLTEESGETSVLGRYAPTDRSLFFVRSVDAPHPLRYRINLFQHIPVGVGASGRAAAAWLPADDISEAYRAVSDHWPSQSAFEAELEAIRVRGYAVSHGEKFDGAVGIAAPVFASGKTLIGSLSVTIPQHRFENARIEEIAGHVTSAAAEISRLSGSRPNEEHGA